MLFPDQPAPSGLPYRGQKGPNDRVEPPDAANLSPQDPLERAKLIADCIRYLERAPLKTLSIPTREILVEYGLLERGIIFHHLYTQTLLDLSRLFAVIPNDAQHLASRSLVSAVDRFGRRAVPTLAIHLKQVATWFSEHEADLNAVTAEYRKLALAFIEDSNLNLGHFNVGSFREDLWSRYDRLTVDRKLRRYLSTTSEAERESISNYLLIEGKPNDLPFLNSKAFKGERAQVSQKARITALRSWKHSSNFQRLSGECRRPSQIAEAILEQFGRRAFEDFRIINSSSKEKTPGPGYFLSGPTLPTLFHDWPRAADVYARSYSAYGRALSEFADVSMCFMRNGIIVHHPSELYSLPVGELATGLREPYALYIENDHFSGAHDLVALVPWRILRHRIAPCLQKERSETSVSDVSRPGFNLLSLSQECERAGTPVVMLANISTIFGGSVSGYPKGSSPFFSWERGTEQVDPWNFDVLGRLHYQWYLNSKTRDPSPGEPLSSGERKKTSLQRVELLSPLGGGCHLVADCAKGLFDLLDLFYARYDAWKCDLTPYSADSRPRMLVAAQLWHTLLQKRNAPKSEYPVLCLAHRYDWNARPYPLLDTFTMRPYEERISYAAQGHPLTAEEWNKLFVPLIAMRQDGGLLQERENTLILLAREYVS